MRVNPSIRKPEELRQTQATDAPVMADSADRTGRLLRPPALPALSLISAGGRRNYYELSRSAKGWRQ